MIAVTIDGAGIDAQFRETGAFTLVNLSGTKVMSYRFGAKGERVQIFRIERDTPLLALFAGFLIRQARARSE